METWATRRAQEAYEKRRQRPDIRRSRRPAPATVFATVSLCISLVTAYSAFLQQRDDIRIITNDAGLMNFSLVTGSRDISIFSSTMVLLNSGTREAVITGARVGFEQMYERDLHSDSTSPFGVPRIMVEEYVTNIVPFVLKPGEVRLADALLEKQDEAPSTTKSFEYYKTEEGGKQVMVSYLVVGYVTPEVAGQHRIDIMNVVLEESEAPDWVNPFVAAQRQGVRTRSVYKRSRTTVAWLNSLIDWTLSTFR